MKELTQDDTANVGDVLEYHFRILNVFQESQINSLITEVGKIPEIMIINHRIEKHFGYSYLIIKVKVISNPFPVGIVVIAALASTGAIFLYLSLDKIYLLANEAPGTVALGLGALALIGLLLWKYGR